MSGLYQRSVQSDSLKTYSKALRRNEDQVEGLLKAADTYNESYMAGSISNIGKIDLPRAAKPFVHRFDVFVSTDKLQACVCSFGSELTVSFTSAFVSTNVQKDFFRQLTQAGIQVEIQSNRLEDDIQ